MCSGGFAEFISLGSTEEEPSQTPFPVRVTVSRIGGRVGVVAVTWEARLRGSRSAAAADISPSQGLLHFVSNEGNKQIQLSILPDSVPEDREVLLLR